MCSGTLYASLFLFCVGSYKKFFVSIFNIFLLFQLTYQKLNALLQLFDVVYREETLLNVIRSVTRNGRSIILTAVLALILVYMFSIIGYMFFKDDFLVNVDEEVVGKLWASLLFYIISYNVCFQRIGTPSPPPSFRALTIFKPSKPGFTNTYASTLSLDQLSLLFSNARIFRDP